MELYTSRWANQDIAHLDVVPVGISRGLPRWRLPYSYRWLLLLAPSRATFALEDQEEFEHTYRAGLEHIGLETILGALERLSRESGGKPMILLCWEKPGKFCHRRIFARWFEERTGIEVSELQDSMLLTGRDTPTQEALFECE